MASLGSTTGTALVADPARILHQFPGLAKKGYRKTSEADPAYNCIAWAAGRTDQWWWPDYYGYWPPGLPVVETIDAFIRAFELEGYSSCGDGYFEVGFEKIAIYTDPNGIPKHAARQLLSGRWTSKLGQDIDIRHEDPDALAGKPYGQPLVFLRRRLRCWRRLYQLLFSRIGRMLLVSNT